MGSSTPLFEDIAIEEDTQRRVSLLLAMNVQILLMSGITVSQLAIQAGGGSVEETRAARSLAFTAQNVRLDVDRHFLPEQSSLTLFPGVPVGKEGRLLEENMDDLVLGKSDPASLMAFGAEMFRKLPWVLHLLHRYLDFLGTAGDTATAERTENLVQTVVDNLCGDRGVESMVPGTRWEEFRGLLVQQRASEKEIARFKELAQLRTQVLEGAMMRSMENPYPDSENRQMDEIGVLRWTR